MIHLPRLYAILDAGCIPNAGMLGYAEDLAAAGVTLLQYRNKIATARQVLEHARELKRRLGNITLIINDRPDLCLGADFKGVHLGQDDLPPESARKIIGPNRWLGVSTHNPDQLTDAANTSADYVAIGPVFATSSKANPDPVVGLEGVRRARALTSKPLVAIGGITRANCRSVIDAGADSVAVISDLINDPRKAAEDFFCILG